MNDTSSLDERVLILPPTAKDAEATERLLADNRIPCHICRSLADLCREAERGAGAVLLTEEAVAGDETGLIARLSEQQEQWSALPLLVLTRPGIMSRGSFALLSNGRNFTLLDRPVQLAVLLSAIQSALRDRRRQYVLRDYIAHRESAERAAREADQKKDEFLAMLGHELRNPLAAISSAVQLIKLPQTREEAKRVAHAALERQVKLLSRLIDDLLDISRISKGKIVLQRAPLDMKAAVQRSVAVVRPAIESAGQELRIELDPEDVWIAGDSARIEQVLINLLSNAARYTRRGGTIVVGARAEGERVVVSVRDTGIGISPELMPTIFDLFTQGENALVQSHGGLGIGLALVRKLVALHGGEVSVESPGVGQGSTFVVTFDRIDPPSASADGGEERVRHCRNHKRVLVVDDNTDAAQTLALCLAEGGHEVEVAFDGKEAVEKARAFHPHAALLDIGLPDQSGYELAGTLLGTPGLENLLLIAVSGLTKEADRSASKAAGFDYHLAKPVDHDRLLELLS